VTKLLKLLLKKYLGQPAWIKLTEFKQELRYRKISCHMDASVRAKVEKVLPSNGFYVDIGAHDGRASSNTFHLEHSGWNGILVEPIMTNYFKLFVNRRRENNHFVNAACVSKNYKDQILEMIYCDLMSFAPSVSEVESGQWLSASSQFMNPNEHQTTVFVPARSLVSILDEYKAPRIIDFLSIDVEGSELGVLDGMDLYKYQVNVACIETANIEKVLSIFDERYYENIGYVNGNLILKRRD
jgi:FkbM family methyltransferase